MAAIYRKLILSLNNSLAPMIYACQSLELSGARLRGKRKGRRTAEERPPQSKKKAVKLSTTFQNRYM
jgi:hypothetical protein